MNLKPIKGLLITALILFLPQCGIKKDLDADFEQDGPHTHLRKAEKTTQP
jgi:hypothetical protein